MNSIILYCASQRLSPSKQTRIYRALDRLKSEGINLTMADFLGIGGYNICFINPSNKDEVIRIYFQCNVADEAQTVATLKAVLEVMPTPLHISINDIRKGNEYLCVSVPKLVPLLLITSEQMAKDLHRLTVDYFDYMSRHNFFNLDVKLDNIGYDPVTKHYQMMDIDCHKKSSSFPKFDPIRTVDVFDLMAAAAFAPILRYGTTAYAFAIALLRFGIRSDFNYINLLAKDFLKVYSWLVGIHFYQEYIFTNHVARSSLHHGLTPEEVYAKRDFSIYEDGLKEIVNLNCFDSQAIYVTDELEEEALVTDFSVESLSLAKVRSMLPSVLPNDLKVKDGKLAEIGTRLYNQLHIHDIDINSVVNSDAERYGDEHYEDEYHEDEYHEDEY